MKHCVWIMVFIVVGCEGSEVPSEPSQPDASHLWIIEEDGPPRISLLDVQSQTLTTSIEIPPLSFAFDLDENPLTQQLALSYTPPPLNFDVGFDRSHIVLANEAQDFERNVCDDRPGSWCFFPRWTKQGQALWFVHEDRLAAPDEVAHRLRLVDTVSASLLCEIDWGTEPAVSDEHIAYILVDPKSGERRLELANASGEWLRTLAQSSNDFDLGLPFFSASGERVFFIRYARETLSFFDHLSALFIPSAHAHGGHNSVGEIWSLSLNEDNDEAKQVSHENTIIYDARIDEGGQWIFAATREGVIKINIASAESDMLVQTRLARAIALKH